MWFGTDQSVADYYDEASFGLLDLEPATESDTALGGRADDGVVVVDVPTAHPNSGSNFAVFQDTVNDILSDSQLDAAVDFAAYDTDNDNHISPDELHLAVVVAGTEAAQGCNAPSIWAHRNSLDRPGHRGHRHPARRRVGQRWVPRRWRAPVRPRRPAGHVGHLGPRARP